MASSRSSIALFFAVLAFQITFASGHIYSYDELVILETAENIAARGIAALDPTPNKELYAKYGRDGGLYSKFGFGMSAVLVPFRLLRIEYFANAFLIALVSLVFFRAIKTSHRSAVVTALLFAFSTIIAPYGRGLFSDVLVALAVLLAFRMAMESRPAFAGAAVAIAVSARVEYVLIVPGLLLLMKPKEFIRFFLPLAIGLALLMTYNYVRFGNPFDQGTIGHDPGDSFSTPLLTGLYGLFLSPGKGFFWFAPLFFLALPRFRKHWKILVIVIPVIILHAKWHSWMGGWAYGPRRMIGVLPLLLLPAAESVEILRSHMKGKFLLLAIGLFGFTMQLGGLTTNFMTYHEEAKGSLLWSISHSGAVGQVRDLLLTGRTDMMWLPGAPVIFCALIAVSLLFSLLAFRD